ncbi:Phosphotransferase enzyme family protein [Tsukamurella pulmonis]|uniref:Phosphotransferase enzyme family protein n=3 Tax=Tsukamurella pulmonis TaxID=47312 RepID=A0A1H1HK27_9ACTN|nr:Phosphotransferase enzyme family protein [Tsukamurella pulmonis]SUP14228.1 Phosphotransferase enzyme family [Tsukamurella pulmonis]
MARVNEMTDAARAARTASAVDAAVAAARELGLEVTDAAVLHDLFSVVVRLEPAPVVVRMPTVLPATETLASLARRQSDELAVTAWLAERGVPVLEPSPLVPARPVQRDGFSMTFWAYVEEAAAEPDYAANAERTAALHTALREYPGELGFLATADPDGVDAHLDLLAGRPDLLPAEDVARAREQWAGLAPAVRSRAAFEARFPGVELQPVHGDCPPANMFTGVDGLRYADFELITLGPVEWDLATLGPELAAAYDRGAAAAGVRGLRPDVLEFVDAVGMLRAITALALVPQLPELAGYLQPVVEQWRGMR